MQGKTILKAAVAGGVLVALILAFQLGRGWNGSTPEAMHQVLEQRLEPLDGMEARLVRLEQEIQSLRGVAPKDGTVETGDAVTDAEARWAGVESSLSTLADRVDGLEQDPVARGFSYLESENAELRREGVNMLTRVAKLDPEARAAMRALLADPSARVREQAAQRLGDLRDKESVSAMKTLLDDSDPRTRRRAIEALERTEARDASRQIGQNLVSDADDRVRVTAARALRRLKSPESEEFLTRALEDANNGVRGEAIVALGELRATAAAPRLRALYDQDPGNHRIRLVQALQRLGDEAPLQKEVGRLANDVKNDADDRVRQQGIRELSILARDASQEIFTQALEDPSPRVRDEAERALR